MREDMFKVIVERPRAGWRSRRHRRGTLNGDCDLPSKIGVKRHIAVMRIRSKELNENLAPLERYIAKQVGRPWNDVYSDISANLAPENVVQQHVRRHVGNFVAKVAVGRNGEWMTEPHDWYHGLPWHQRFYVDPEDGILKESAKLWEKRGIDERRRRRRAPELKPDPDLRVLDDTRELRRINGIWYEFEFDEHPKSGFNPLVYDYLTKGLAWAHARHAIAKRQLSRTELKAHGIENIENI